MLMVIFGAGATYDSAAYFPVGRGAGPAGERPPLADELFDNRAIFQTARDHYPQFVPIVPELLYRGEGATVEQVLRQNLERAATYPQLHEQLAAIRYYLQWIMRHAVGQWYSNYARRASNHATLIHQLRQAKHVSRSSDPVCLVTFNYDFLLELALGSAFNSIDDYVNDPAFKLFKLHGSVNWVREVLSEVQPIVEMTTDPLAAARLLISKAASLKLSPTIAVAEGTPPAVVGAKLFFPAIAIPVERKSDFECPAPHLELLRELLPKVDKVLIIGWRATEDHFLKFLMKSMRPGAEVVACCGSHDKADATLAALRPYGIGSKFVPLQAGFSEMVANRQLDGFLAGC